MREEGVAMPVLVASEVQPEDGDSAEQLTGDIALSNRRVLKKKRQLLTRGRGTKRDYFDVYGAEAKAELVVQPPANLRLKFQDLQGLVTWILADGENPKWVFVKNKPLVTKVVMLHIPGLDAALYMEHPALCKSLTQCCGRPRAVVGVSPMATLAQTVEALFSCVKPRTKQNKILGLKREHPERSSSDSEEEEQVTLNPNPSITEDGIKRRRLENDEAHNLHGENQPSFPASHYTLTARQMHENGYPKYSLGEDMPCGFVRTLPTAAGTTPLKMAAVDCEMCHTKLGLELTRVSMVNSDGKVLLDKLVKPENAITNYLTQYSGITAAMMADVSTTLADVQEEVLKLVQAETVLVGHSVENDLMALKLLHALVIDTALLYHHPTRGPMCKPALRMLAGRYLKRKIQGDKSGHDSVEDARAAMDLVLLKISKGPAFGKRMKPNRESLIGLLGRHGRQSSLIDRRPTLHQYAVGSCNAIIANSDDDVCAKAVKEVKKPAVDFVWAQFTDLNAWYEEQARATSNWSNRMAELVAMMTCSEPSKLKCNSNEDRDLEGAGDPVLPEGLQIVLARLDGRFKKVHDALEPNTLLIVATGHGDTVSVRRLQELKWKTCQNKEGSLEWTRSHQDVLEELAARAETTLAFTCIK